MEGLSYLRKNFNIVENRFIQQSVKSKLVLGNAVRAVGKKSILAFWRQIHLKIPCQPPGAWQISDIQYKSDRGGEKIQQQARGRHGLKTLFRLNFRPERAEE